MTLKLANWISRSLCFKITLKGCSKKECCKHCSHVKFKGTMTKWPVHKQTHRTTQKKHVEHQDAKEIQKKKTIFIS